MQSITKTESKPKTSPIRLGVKNYTEDEILIIRQHFDPLDSLRSCQKIQEKYIRGRTVSAIIAKASKLGLQRPVRLRKWDKEELFILENNIEESLSSIHKNLQLYWIKNDMPPMGYSAVRRQAMIMGKGTRCQKDGYITKEYLAEAMGCSLHVITTWSKVYKNVLRPENPSENVRTIFFPINGFRKFAKEYPGEIAKCRPNIVWLIDTLFGYGL
jgi:hypothetical protein